MKKIPKIIQEFTQTVRHLFESDKEFDDFLHTPDHFWSSGDHLTDLSNLKFLAKSRRTDKLIYTISLVKELKETLIIPSDTLSETLKPVYERK